MSNQLGSLPSLSLSATAIIECPRCGRKETIPPKHGLRLPNTEPTFCHEVVHLMTGKLHHRGDSRG